MMTYNRAVAMPDCVQYYYGRVFNLRTTRHAEEQTFRDQYGPFSIPRRVTVTHDTLVEVTVDAGRITKFLVRVPNTENQDTDICLVFIPDFTSGVVKTAWLCKRSDQHTTLDRARVASSSVLTV